MKKTICNCAVLMLLSILLITSLAGAISSTFRESYGRKETMIGEITGAILEPIAASQIRVKKGSVPVAVEFEIRKLNDRWFLWLVAPQNSGSYTLFIDDILTMVEGAQQYVDYQKNFAIENSLADYTIRPGFVSTNEDFAITSTSYLDAPLPVTTNFPEPHEIILQPGETETTFPISGASETSLTFIEFGIYQIPAYLIVAGEIANNSENISNGNISEGNVSINQTNGSIIGGNASNATNQTNNSEINYSPSFAFVSPVIVVQIPAGSGGSYSFEIENTGEEDIRNIRFEFNPARISINEDTGEAITPGETRAFNLILLNTSTGFREAVIARAGNATRYFLFVVNISDAGRGVDYLDTEQSNQYFYCSELSGRICSAEEECSGDEVESLDGLCCLEQCELESRSSSSWIGYLIAGIVVLILLVIYVKYRKSAPKKEESIAKGFSFANNP